MSALLDTHCFLWAVTDPTRIPANVREFVADPANEIALSTVTFWEIAIKFALGKLELQGGTPDDLLPAAREMGLTIVTPTAEESIGFHKLPKTAHRDPFDRMLIWQCLQRHWTLIARDGDLDEYRAMGLKTLW